MIGFVNRFVAKLRTPSAQWGAGSLVIGGMAAGMIGWAAFGEVVTYTNRLEFCTSCHAMQVAVYPEYKQSVHYQNRAGVRAVCADCHVPHATIPKLWRKFQATYKEVPKAITGAIDTPEKFEARRQVLAENVWRVMKATDSRECRNCHSREAMKLSVQKPRARGQHEDAVKSGETCIDCHKGIAHHLPASVPTKVPDSAPASDAAKTEAEATDDFAL